MKSFNQLRNEIQEKMSKKDMKKLGVEDPLSGKGYPYQEDGVDERHAPLPKATGFAITYSYKGKDNKFVTKLTNIGGKVDRKKKEVRFDFDSAAARTKFRKKNKKVLDSLNESVELDELKRDEAEVVFDFKSERDAKQFAKDVENSAVGLANKGVERYKGKYRVVITGMTTDMHKKAIGKYAHKNKGKFSHSSSEVTPKGYGPYDESVEQKTFNQFKEQIANVAGSGEVAGLGSEPPVSKAAQKKKQRGATGDIARRSSVPAPKKGDLIPPALGENTETFAGCRVFEVDDEEYGKATYGRKKWERWNKKFDMENENNKMIRTYASRNPGKPVVIKNKKTGDMSYLINKSY